MLRRIPTLALAALATLGACGASTARVDAPEATRSDRVTFRGMCDASAAVPIDKGRFVIADDEDNVLRVYDVNRGGDPVAAVDLGPALDLPLRGTKQPRFPEVDIEAATRIGDRAVWLASHGRNAKGKPRPERLRLFATTTTAPLAVTGRVYTRLLDDLFAEPRLAPFALAEAAELAPKAPGGLNIEGLTATPDGAALIGFRNPLIGGRALIVPLENPLAIFDGEAARFGEPVLLDLGGRGVRGISWWRGQYLIAAGSPTDAREPGAAVYTWDGHGAPVRLATALDGLNPEAFYSPDDHDLVMVFSDDGSADVDGTACKDLADPAKKSFRGAWIRLPR